MKLRDYIRSFESSCELFYITVFIGGTSYEKPSYRGKRQKVSPSISKTFFMAVSVGEVYRVQFEFNG